MLDEVCNGVAIRRCCMLPPHNDGCASWHSRCVAPKTPSHPPFRRIAGRIHVLPVCLTSDTGRTVYLSTSVLVLAPTPAQEEDENKVEHGGERGVAMPAGVEQEGMCFLERRGGGSEGQKSPLDFLLGLDSLRRYQASAYMRKRVEGGGGRG
jgi:hypothetical protein